MKALVLLLTICSHALGAITVSNITYSSSIDAISDLLGVVYFDAAITNQPVLVYMHGYNGTVDSMDKSIFTNFVSNGWFCLVPDMRGRDGHSGVRDDGGREIMDIYDGLVYVRAHCLTSQSNAVLLGVSGGGG